MWIGLSQVIATEKLESLSNELLRPRKVEILEEFPESKWPEVLAIIDSTESEFPQVIEFYNLGSDEKEVQKISIQLAILFSQQLQISTICDGSGYGDNDNPYWSLICDGGKVYLADDCDSAFFGESETQPVKILREIELDFEFNLK